MGWERGGCGPVRAAVPTLCVVRIVWSLWLETLPDYPRGEHAAFGEWGSMLPKKNTDIFFVFFRCVD